MKKLRLKLNKNAIFKVTCLMFLILGTLSLTIVPNTNAYFKMEETKVLELQNSLYEVEEVKIDVSSFELLSTGQINASLIFHRNDKTRKNYKLQCGNTTQTFPIDVNDAKHTIICDIDSNNTSEKINVEIYEIIENIPFFCGTITINYSNFNNLRSNLVTFLTENQKLQELNIWNTLTPHKYLRDNKILYNTDVTKGNLSKIGIIMNEDNNFSLDTNFVGYVKTYNYYTNLFDSTADINNDYKMYFTTDENENATLSDKNAKLRNAFKTYLEKYIYTASTESNMVEKVYNYIINKCQDFTQIVNGNLKIKGLTKVDDYIALDKVEIQKAITEYEEELKKYEDFLTQTDNYKDNFSTTTNYLNSLPKTNTNPIYTAITDKTYSKNPQYIVYYDQTKDGAEQYLSLVEILNNGTTSTLTISKLDQTSINNMLSTISEKEKLYIDIYADEITANTLKSEFEKLLENKSFAIVSNVQDYGYKLISYEIKGTSPLNVIVDEPQEDDENKEENSTFNDYQKYLDTIKEKYNQNFEKTYAYVSEASENNIFYKNFISTNPTNLNYIYFEKDEEEIALTYISMTKEKEISIETLTKDMSNELNNQLETGLKVHLTTEDDSTKVINAVNTLLEINPVGLAKTTNFALTTFNDTVLTYISASDGPTSDITIQNLNNLDNTNKQQLIAEINTKTEAETGFTINYQNEKDKSLLTNTINTLLDFTPSETEELSKYIISDDNNSTITYKLNPDYQTEITPPENLDNPEETEPANPEDGNKDENLDKDSDSTNPANPDNQADDNQDQALDEAPNALAGSSAEPNSSTPSQPELSTSNEVPAPTLEINNIDAGLNNI